MVNIGHDDLHEHDRAPAAGDAAGGRGDRPAGGGLSDGATSPRRTEAAGVAARLGAAPARADADHAAGSPGSAACSCSSRSSFVVVWLPMHTFDPPPSTDWAPLTDQAVKGRNLFASNNCFVCHSGYSRPQDVREALYFLYPKVSQPGDFYGSDQSPNLLGTERTGPDLSQESGWHPDDWQCAHFYDPRFVDPLSLMPPMKSLFSDTQVEHLTDVRRDAQRQVRAAALRRAALREARGARRTRASRGPYTGFQGAHKPILEGRRRSEPPKDQLEEAPNLVADRPQLLAVRRPAARDRAEPPARQGGLPRALRRLPRAEGRRQGTGARSFMSPPPADFTDKDDACCGGDTGPGDFYYRILRGWPGTGDGELRRAPLGRRHLARGAVRQDDPERHAATRTASRSRRTTSPGSRRRSCSPG